MLGRNMVVPLVLLALGALATILLAHTSFEIALRHNRRQLKHLTGQLREQLEAERQAQERLRALIGG